MPARGVRSGFHAAAFGNTAIFLLLAVGALICLFPFSWMISTSLRSSDELFLYPPKLIHNYPLFKNYLDIWAMAPFCIYFLNSMIITSCIMLGEVVTSAL